MRPRYYRLDREHKVAIPCTREEWRPGCDNAIRQTTMESGIFVSTIFLWLDHNWRMGPDVDPVLFETMIFSSEDAICVLNEEDLGRYRYATWAEAEAHHERIVEQLAAKQREVIRDIENTRTLTPEQ